jgi:putative nucleotidyltransferase with HDIG domain
MSDARAGANRICAVLRKHGHEALLAGGCVRDTLLGVIPKDYDIATSATPDEVDNLFSRCVAVGAAFGVMLVIESEGEYEVATFRSDGPYKDGRHPSSVTFSNAEEDAKRRDFTINALFMDAESGEIYDFVDGRRDLDARIIRAVGDAETRFREDHLRLMRAVRFSCQLGFEIEPATLQAAGTCAAHIIGTSPERIRNELKLILTQSNPDEGILLLEQTGLLAHILPEVALMKGCEQPPEFHPEGDVFVHTLLCLRQLHQPSFTLAMGVLLHDVGKPLTQTFEDRIRFNRHEKVGAFEAEKICRRLHVSNAQAQRIVWLVSRHMRIAAARDMRESKRRRLVREDAFEELLALFRADCLGSRGDLETYEWLKTYAEDLTPEQTRPPRFLTGHDLIDLGYPQGPDFKEILAGVEDGQLEGVILNRADAIDYVQHRWPLPKG